MSPTPPRREDIFVSVCFPDLSARLYDFEAVQRVAAQIGARFRYWEVLVIAEATQAEAYEPLFATVSNLRLLNLRPGTTSLRRRVVAASEAIGDVVLLTSVSEIDMLDLVAAIEMAHANDAIVTCQREHSGFLDPVITTLGNAGGFRVTSRDMRSAAYPRTLLNLLLAHPDRQLALRFAPRDGGIPVLDIPANGAAPRRSMRDTGYRLTLIQKLVINSAPRVLGYLSILSAVVFVSAVLLALYAVGAWIVLEQIAPGWLTLTLSISLTAAFLGASVFGLSSGLQRLIDLVSPKLSHDVIGEQSAVDLFGEVQSELNIEIETATLLAKTALSTPDLRL